MQPSVSPREQVRLLREAGISFSQIADTLGVNENTARGWASKDNFVHTRPADSPLRSKTPTFDDIEVPGMEQEPLEEAIHLPDSNALLISDLHIPLHSSLMVRRAIWIAKTHFPSVRRVID